MVATRRVVGSACSLVIAAVLAVGSALAGQSGGSDQQQKDNTAAVREFTIRVQDYVKLRNTIEAQLPPLVRPDLQEMIAAHQQVLARKIREARPGAKSGDVFFAQMSRDAIRHAIRAAFQGPQAANARASIQQGSPLTEVHLRVNAVYPNTVPYTTVPPSFLSELPKLPDEVAYVIVGQDLVLLDLKANLVVDVIPEVLP